MANLLSRKEVREKLGLTDRTLRRKLEELNIECVSVVENGIESKKIPFEEYLRLAEECDKKQAVKPPKQDEPKDIALYNLKTELYKAQLSLDNAKKDLNEKEATIAHLHEENARVTGERNSVMEKNDRLFNMYHDENQKYIAALQKINELQQGLIQEKSKGFFSRLFGR